MSNILLISHPTQLNPSKVIWNMGNDVKFCATDQTEYARLFIKMITVLTPEELLTVEAAIKNINSNKIVKLN